MAGNFDFFTPGDVDFSLFKLKIRFSYRLLLAAYSVKRLRVFFFVFELETPRNSQPDKRMDRQAICVMQPRGLPRDNAGNRPNVHYYRTAITLLRRRTDRHI